MSCESCTVKFTLFKRKKQCMDCLHYFCAGCVIRRRDRVLSCDNCSMLSRRPLIKSQIIQMKTRHLRNFLEAKNVNIKGCVEKDDLVNLLILYVNGRDDSQRSTHYNDYSGYRQTSSYDRPIYFESPRFQNSERENNTENHVTQREDEFHNSDAPNSPVNQDESRVSETEETERLEPVLQQNQNNCQSESNNESNSEQTNNPPRNDIPDNDREIVENISDARSLLPSDEAEQISLHSDTGTEQMIVEDIDDLEESQRRIQNAANESVHIEEVTENDSVARAGPEPIITESDENTEVPTIRESSAMFTEIKTWPENVKLSDIQLSSELDQLTTKQLKYLLVVNRVDFKGCVERHELLDRVLRLWTEYQQSRKEVENCDMDSLCKICLDAPIECVILECGHIACCIDCGKQMAECPICRQYIVRVVRIFRC